jgi:uracil-DNA glycosylase family 4
MLSGLGAQERRASSVEQARRHNESVPPLSPASLADFRPHPITGQPFASPVPPGLGWPDDEADAATPVATDAAEVGTLAATAGLREVYARSSVCRACPRLVAWREEVAAAKRRSFADQPYWGRPTPGWGDPEPRVVVIGLAPAANGGNRTGRVFTGDRSGDWLYAALHRAGLANQPTSEHAGDGLRLTGARIVPAVRCAPPANKPTPAERDTCAQWLDREMELVRPSTRAVVALGSFAWSAALGTLARIGFDLPRPRPKFGHGVEVKLASDGAGVRLIGCYHPSQQNTFTGVLTASMLDDVFARANASG